MTKAAAPIMGGSSCPPTEAVEATAKANLDQILSQVRAFRPMVRDLADARAAMDEALKCRETGEAKTILFGLTGTGYFDMTAYEKFHNGEMTDYIPTDEELQASFDQLPQVN